MAIDVITEEVATNLEEVASATRSINTSGVGYLLGGLCIGAGLGFYFGRKLQKAKLRAEAFAEAETEIAQVREIYRQKTVALEGEKAKVEASDLQTLVEERGYVTPADLPVRPLPPPVPIIEAPTLRDSVGNGELKVSKDPNAGWDAAKELNLRTPDAPYIIHQSEYEASDFGYTSVVYTYYAGDDVLVDTGDNAPITNGDEVVGADNLKWGHGSDDEDVVFVRNDRLELDIQICRSPKSYEEEVLGLENEST